MGPRLPIKTASRVFFAGAALLLLGACATAPVEPETGGPGQKVSSAQVLSICEKLAKSKDTRLAIGLCEKAHMEDQQNPVPLLLLGDMLQQQGALAQAGRAYGMAIDLDPENVEAHYGLGKVFLARNQFDLAIEQFEVARELNTRDHRLYNALGVVLDNLGDHVAAQAHYKIGLELAPDNHALQKNLILSRRLDSSVTTPAIGPRHKVVPRPVSPQSLPDQAQPEAVPQAPAAPASPTTPGRLGHEPLAQVPESVEVPVRDSFTAAAAMPAPQTAGVPDLTRQRENSLSGNKAAQDAKVAAVASFERRDVLTPKTRLIPLPPRAKPPVPAAEVRTVTLQDSPALSPPAVKPARSVATVATSRTRPASNPVLSTESAYDEIPLPALREVAAAGREAPGALAPRKVEQGPRILASGFGRASIKVEVLPPMTSVLAEARIQRKAPMQQLAQRPRPNPHGIVDEVPVAKVEALAAHKPDHGVTEVAVVVSSDSTTSIADESYLEVGALNPRSSSIAMRETSMTRAARPADSTALTTRAEPVKLEQVASPQPLSLVSRGLVQTASLQSGEAAIPDAGVQDESILVDRTHSGEHSKVRQSRRPFGREHEEDHETRSVKGEFWDLVDIVNPMQHIPVVATIYRDVTDDEIKPAAKIAGGTLFGGVLGFASSLVDSMVEEVSGQDIGQTALAAMTEPKRETVADLNAPAEQSFTPDTRYEEFHLADARGR